MPRVLLAGDSYKDKDLAELLRRYKYGKNLTMEQLGKQVGVSKNVMCAYIKEPARIPLHVLRALQKKLQIPKEDLLPFLI